MNYIVDIIILAIILISVFIGYKRGLIKCAVSVLSFFIAIIVVIILTTPISNLIIDNTKIDDNIKGAISKNLNFEDSDNIELTEDYSNYPEVVRNYINDIMDDLSNDTTEVVNTLAENISTMIINIAVAIILFFGTKLVLKFVKVLATIIDKIPLIKQCDKVGGIIYGVISGIVRVYIILAVISMIAPMLTDSAIIQAINDSILGGNMYNNNIVLKIIL